jgi:hypothetical protein
MVEASPLVAAPRPAQRGDQSVPARRLTSAIGALVWPRISRQCRTKPPACASSSVPGSTNEGTSALAVGQAPAVLGRVADVEPRTRAHHNFSLVRYEVSREVI